MYDICGVIFHLIVKNISRAQILSLRSSVPGWVAITTDSTSFFDVKLKGAGEALDGIIADATIITQSQYGGATVCAYV